MNINERKNQFLKGRSITRGMQLTWYLQKRVGITTKSECECFLALGNPLPAGRSPRKTYHSCTKRHRNRNVVSNSEASTWMTRDIYSVKQTLSMFIQWEAEGLCFGVIYIGITVVIFSKRMNTKIMNVSSNTQVK